MRYSRCSPAAEAYPRSLGIDGGAVSLPLAARPGNSSSLHPPITQPLSSKPGAARDAHMGAGNPRDNSTVLPTVPPTMTPTVLRTTDRLRRSRNLRAVQAHLRHSDIQTTTVYTKMTQAEPQKVVNLFDDNGK
jgi:integrase